MAWAHLLDIQLEKAICNRTCVLFVGSGISSGVSRKNRPFWIDAGINAGRLDKNLMTKLSLPGWPDLLLEMLERAIYDKVLVDTAQINELTDLIKGNIKNGKIISGKLLVAAQALRDIFDSVPQQNQGSWNDFLEQLFNNQYLDPPSKVHEAITKINFRGIVTTNYDHLIETAYFNENAAFPQVIQIEDIGRITPLPVRPQDPFFIFKAHGQFDTNNIILGTRDYQEVMYNKPGYRRFLETIFTTYTLLFIGFGGQDPNFESILDSMASIFNHTLDNHFALMPSWEVTGIERIQLGKDRRLQVIPFNDYPEILDFMLALQNLDCDITLPNAVHS